MTPLRQQMIDVMQQRGYAPRTQQSYLEAVSQLAIHYHRSPAELTEAEVKAFIKSLTLERHLAPSSCWLYWHAIRFLYRQVLQQPAWESDPILPKRKQRIPELLTRAEVRRLLQVTRLPKHRLLLTLCYGCGLRVSEVVAIRISDIDGERQQLRINQGKGGKDRFVPLAPALLQQLRRYWLQYQPKIWLFAHDKQPDRHLGISSAQKIYQKSKQLAAIERQGGIHALRHAYATHQLARGQSIKTLQYQLGHSTLNTTLRYLHWQHQQGETQTIDLIATLGMDDGTDTTAAAA